MKGDISKIILGVILAIVIVLIVFLSLYMISYKLSENGRLSAKAAYALSALPCMFVNTPEAVREYLENAHIIALEMVGVLLAGAFAKGATEGFRSSLRVVSRVREGEEALFVEITRKYKDLRVYVTSNTLKEGLASVGKFIASKRGIKIVGGILGAGFAISGLYNAMNKMAETMTRPIIENLVPTIVISQSDENPDTSEIDKYVGEAYREAVKNNKKAVITYHIAKYAYITNQETLGVKIPFHHPHYTLALAITEDTRISYKDVLCLLNITYRNNKTLYQILQPRGYPDLEVSVSDDVCRSLGIDSSKLIGGDDHPSFVPAIIDMQDPNNVATKLGYIVDGKGLYLIVYVWGPEGLSIQSYKLS